MSEKRFVLKNAYPFDRGEYIFDSNQNKFIIEIDKIIKLLNSLSKENKQLKKELDCIKKTNKSWGCNVECDYEWYEERDNSE